jgi:hypothetical protein
MLDDSSILAMVCIGGMEGIEEEAMMFREMRPGRPIYVLARTGGASALMAKAAHDISGPTSTVRAIDDEFMSDTRYRLRREDGESIDAPLVRELSQGRDDTWPTKR